MYEYAVQFGHKNRDPNLRLHGAKRNLSPLGPQISTKLFFFPIIITNANIVLILVSDSVLPRFAEPIPNVTVTIGKDALMACVVDNLRNYKVH